MVCGLQVLNVYQELIISILKVRIQADLRTILRQMKITSIFSSNRWHT